MLGLRPLRVTGDAERLLDEGRIIYADGKQGNRFNVGARALCDASTTVERHIVRIMRQNCGDAAASIPGAVLSVLHQHARADVKGSARAGARVGGLLLAEKPLTIGGFA